VVELVGTIDIDPIKIMIGKTIQVLYIVSDVKNDPFSAAGRFDISFSKLKRVFSAKPAVISIFAPVWIKLPVETPPDID